jgi:tetratricopeptide (TPR) repeat protein
VARGDLISEIRSNQRRRLIKRAVQLALLALVLLAAGVALKRLGDRRAVAQALQSARTHATGGNASDLRLAGDVLDASVARNPHDDATLAERALLRAHLWVEFGERRDQADEALASAPAGMPATLLARAIMAFGDGDHAAASELLTEVGESSDAIVTAESAWLDGQVVIARAPDDDEALAAALVRIDAALAPNPGLASLRRVRARLLLQRGEADEALAELERARELARAHLGLAADEALFNAVLRREASGVASVADQLLEQGDALPARDRYDTLLARGVVHVRSGELEDGLARIEEAWEGLPRWDRLAVRLAIETALEANAPDLAERWLADADLPEQEVAIDRAWALLDRAEIMKALAQLAELPQEHPRVAYLQALALVEQGRFAEAEPWIGRTEELLPGRIEIEVARARAELRTGDKAVALRKLRALAEEEPYAPRAWTGLGEAELALAEPGASDDLRRARIALERALEREPHAAEAMLLLADVWNRRRKLDPEGVRTAGDLLERAVETNPHLPRYREQLAYFLADTARTVRARKLLAELVDEPGIAGATVIRYVQLSAEAGDRKPDYDALLAQAKELGIDAEQLDRERARVALLVVGERDDIVGAQRLLAGLVQRNPADVESRVLLSETWARQYDRKEAELAIRRGFPVTPDAQHGRLFLAWADIESRMGKPRIAAPRARSAWLRMLDEDRPAAELLTAADLATRLWLRQDNERIALTIAEQLTQRLPLHAEAWTIRAQVELSASETAAARSSADKAIELDPDNPRAHEIRGHCLLRFGQKDKARQAYERAVELVKGTRAEKAYRENLRRL